MNLVLDEIDLALLKAVIEQPGIRQRAAYMPFLDIESESKLWKRVQALIEYHYLKRVEKVRSNVVLYPTQKSKKLVNR